MLRRFMSIHFRSIRANAVCEEREMTDVELKAFDEAFEQFGRAFAAMGDAFDSLKRRPDLKNNQGREHGARRR